MQHYRCHDDVFLNSVLMEKVTAILLFLIILILFKRLQYFSWLYHVIINGFGYRLGDFIKRTGGFEFTIYYIIFGMLQRSDSIVHKYYRKTFKPNDIEILSNIVSVNNQENNSTISIHLRLGDVIDNHERSVDDFLFNESSSKNNNKTIGTRCDFNSCKSEGYVKPMRYYEEILKKIPNSITKIKVFSGSFKETKNPHKSKDYLKKISAFFKQNGYNVEINWNKNADDDFKQMCNSKYFVPSGGGFSTLISDVVKYKGGRVL